MIYQDVGLVWFSWPRFPSTFESAYLNRNRARIGDISQLGLDLDPKWERRVNFHGLIEISFWAGYDRL
jgi:hypothetical protein